MKALMRVLNVLSWPIWLKLTVALLVAILIPVLLVAFFTHASFNDVNARYIEAYVSENGQRQAAAINEALVSTQTRFSAFVTSTTNALEMARLLEGDSETIRSQSVSRLLRDDLLRDSMLRQARLLNSEGSVVIQADAGSRISMIDRSPSLAYATARAAFEQTGRRLTLTIGDDGKVELAHAITARGGRLLGYLVAVLDNNAVFLNNLGLSGAVYAAYSYVVSSGANRAVIVRDEARAAAETAVGNSVAVARALGGLPAGTDRYRVGANRDMPVIGYYAPIPDPTQPDRVAFSLVTEASLTAPMTQLLAYFGGARAFAVIIGPLLLLVLLVLLLTQFIVPPLTSLRQAMQAAAQGDYNAPVEAVGRGDEIGQLSSAFVDMRLQMRTLLDDLEARIAARARDLSATYEVSHFAASQRDLQLLLNEAVNLIVKHFLNIYHAQIFLLDADHQYAVLRASTGEVGEVLLKRGHRLAVGSVSVIGQVVQQGQVVVARDTATSNVHRRNEFLPHTRAELAIPLRVSDRIIGALDVQSKHRNAFKKDEILVLQSMADQLAVAIENARLYEESMARLAEVERANRLATLTAWQEYLYGQRRRSLASEAGTVTGVDLTGLRAQAAAERRIVIGAVTDQGTVPVAVPIQLAGQVIGAVEWELPAEHLNENRLLLAQELANRLAVSLDNARLFEESQRATERERVVNAIAARLTPQTEVSEILQTAVREVGQALRAPQVSIRLHHGNGSNGSNGNGSGHTTQNE